MLAALLARQQTSAGGSAAAAAAAASPLSPVRFVLASASPRRRELLENCGGPPFVVVPSRFSEDLDKASFVSAADYAQETARHKALDVALRSGNDAVGANAVIIGADTVVELDGEVLEKPRDAEHAKEMLKKLSGTAHEVHTGMALVLTGVPDPSSPSGLFVQAFSESTVVHFTSLSEEMIDAYVQSGEPMDKAGAYGIQGKAASFVTGIQGCYFNVVGLPVHRFCKELLSLSDTIYPQNA